MLRCVTNDQGGVKGSLRKHFSWWQNNCNNVYINNIIKDGYKLPLVKMPVREFLKNNLSARSEPDFVTQELDKLVVTGVLIQHAKYWCLDVSGVEAFAYSWLRENVCLVPPLALENPSATPSPSTIPPYIAEGRSFKEE